MFPTPTPLAAPGQPEMSSETAACITGFPRCQNPLDRRCTDPAMNKEQGASILRMSRGYRDADEYCAVRRVDRIYGYRVGIMAN